MRVRSAEAGVRQEERREEERDRRWWATEQRKEKPPAYLQLERVYKGMVKGLKARLALAEAQKCTAEAESELRWLLLGREEWEHASPQGMSRKPSGNV